MTLWPLVEFGRAVWLAVSGFARDHPVLAVTLVLALVGCAVVLIVERE